mmetsp:Transcript_37952/g.64627  ORF Transcript_37952/g.64627 Transcript_37952/m.64627 type:complete len:312 (-) Transcript_37952:80-1015(-)
MGHSWKSLRATGRALPSAQRTHRGSPAWRRSTRKGWRPPRPAWRGTTSSRTEGSTGALSGPLRCLPLLCASFPVLLIRRQWESSQRCCRACPPSPILFSSFPQRCSWSLPPEEAERLHCRHLFPTAAAAAARQPLRRFVRFRSRRPPKRSAEAMRTAKQSLAAKARAATAAMTKRPGSPPGAAAGAWSGLDTTHAGAVRAERASAHAGRALALSWEKEWWGCLRRNERFEEVPWAPDLLDPRKGMLGGGEAAMRQDKMDLEAPTLRLSRALGLGWEPIPVTKVEHKRASSIEVAQAERNAQAMASMGFDDP